MKSELLAKSPLLILPLVALFVFLAIFAVIVVTTLLKKEHPAAKLPLDGDER